MHDLANGMIEGEMAGWLARWLAQWMDGWMDGWMSRRMDNITILLWIMGDQTRLDDIYACRLHL